MDTSLKTHMYQTSDRFQQDADLINADRQKQASMTQEHLEALGVDVRIAQYSGDNSFPTEYTLSFRTIIAGGPTMDIAVLNFVEKLLNLEREKDEK